MDSKSNLKLVDLNTKQPSRELKTIEEYFDFLEQYWQIFEPPKEPKQAPEYKIVLL